MPITNPITKGGYLVTIKGLDTYWVEFSGIEDETQTSEHSDGLSNRIYQAMGARKLKPITLSKEFDPIKDAAIIDWWMNWQEGKSKSETLSIVPIRYSPKPEPIGKSFTVYGVRPTMLKGFEADKKSSDASTLELTIIADEWSYN